MSKKNVVNNLTYVIDDDILKEILNALSTLSGRIANLQTEVESLKSKQSARDKGWVA